MADFDQQQATFPPVTAQAEDDHAQAQAIAFFVPATSFFKMRGRDQTCPSGQQPAYVYWTVQDAADETGAQALVSDLICGSDPLTDIVEIEVAHRWTE